MPAVAPCHPAAAGESRGAAGAEAAPEGCGPGCPCGEGSGERGQPRGGTGNLGESGPDPRKMPFVIDWARCAGR